MSAVWEVRAKGALKAPKIDIFRVSDDLIAQSWTNSAQPRMASDLFRPSQGKLHTGGYVQMVVREGQHELVIGKLGGDHPNWAPANTTYIVDAGQGLEFFLRMAIDFSRVSAYVVPIGPSPIIGSSGAAGITIETLDRDTAMEELSKTSESN